MEKLLELHKPLKETILGVALASFDPGLRDTILTQAEI